MDMPHKGETMEGVRNFNFVDDPSATELLKVVVPEELVEHLNDCFPLEHRRI